MMARSLLVVLVPWLLLAPQGSQAPPAAQRTAATPTEVPEGRALLRVDIEGTELDLYIYRPKDWSGQRMLMVLHGVLRDADQYRDHATGMGDRFGAVVVAPRFDAERFPSRRYQRGGLLDVNGKATPPEKWTYAFIPKIAARMRELLGRPDVRYWIIGHSAGGQFVVRMSAFQETGAERHVAANPGSELFPTRDLPFGYGFGRLPPELSDDERLRRYLAAPLTIYLGTADDKPDQYFDQTDDAMQQGSGRHQRGLACYWMAKTLAAERGWPFAWRLVEAPGIGHEHTKMFDDPACERALFGEPGAGSR